MLAIQHLQVGDVIAAISVTNTFARSYQEQAKLKKKILFVSKIRKKKRKSSAGLSHVSISGGQETYTAAHLEEIRGNDSVCK